MAASTDELLEIVLDVDLSKEPECQGWAHPEGTDGHDGGPAKWIMRFPCCGGHIQICDGRARAHRRTPRIRCARCGEVTSGDEQIFIEL